MMSRAPKVPYIVCILSCADGSTYTGITTDPNRRLEEYKLGTGGRYTCAREDRCQIPI